MAKEDAEDPLCYTKRDEFTSEVFKIEIAGLPRCFGYAQLKKLLNQKLQLRSHKIKVIGPQSTWAFVTFRCETDREQALRTLDGYQWRGKCLTAKKANPAADPLLRKRRNAETANDSDTVKKQKTDGAEENPNLAEQALDAVMPLWKMPYDEQSDMKDKEVRNLLVKLGRQIEKSSTVVSTWLQENRKNFEFLCCQYDGLKRSPVVEGYRNKCEFTVGTDAQGHKPIVGFRLAKYSAGSMIVADPSECSIVPNNILRVCKAFQQFVEHSDRAPFNPVDHSGYWRQLTVRFTTNNHIMAIVVMHPQNLAQEEIDVIKGNLRSYFEEGEGKSCEVTSLYYQSYAKKVPGIDPSLEFLSGTKHIEETLMGFRFRISPDSFFQVNTAAAQLLYTSIGEIASVDDNTVVLDICCGTGAIGISLAKKVNKVIGIDVVASAIDDANYNAQNNGLTNTTFICGKVEDCMASILHKFSEDNVVAIVDPPRAGLHNKVVRSIRACKALRRLVYVACDLAAASTNIVDLCRHESKQYHGQPFSVQRAVAVDLFPHTRHCELVLLLERIPTEDKIIATNTT